MTALDDLGESPGAFTAPDLGPLLSPRVVAVIGATDEPGRMGTMVFQRALRNMEPIGATVHPVNPRRETVAGLRSYPSVCDIEGHVDLAIILTGDPTPGLTDAVAKEVGFAIIFAGGFAEAGEEGTEAQRRIEAIVQGSSTRLLGPNTTFVLYEQGPVRDDRPYIYAVTQGGGHSYFMQQARQIGVPLVRSVATGNEADLTVADFISYFAGLPDTGAVAVYCEGFEDGRAFTQAVAAANARNVPVVMVGLGRADGGRASAVAHTGHLAGSYRVLRGVAAQHGVALVDDLDELIEVTGLLGGEHEADERGVCIITHSGGAAFHLTDLLRHAGVPLAELTSETQARLREIYPAAPQVSNPVDIAGAVFAGVGQQALEALAADPNVGLIISAPTQLRTAAGEPERVGKAMAEEAAAAAATVDKPICMVWHSFFLDEPGFDDLRSSGAYAFTNFRNLVSGVKAFQDYARFRRYAREDGPPDEIRAAAVARGAPASELLEAYGVPQPRERVVALGASVAEAAEAVGWPLVAKIASPDIPHKSDAGLVALDQRDAETLGRTVARFREIVAGLPGAPRIDGVQLSEQVAAGVELIVGITQDAAFGSVVMCGLGGTMTELLDDVAFRLPPFSRAEAERMLRETRAARLLEGYRGAAGGSVEAAIDIIMKVQQMAQDFDGELLELDLNPVIVTAEGATAVDALAVWRTEDDNNPQGEVEG